MQNFQLTNLVTDFISNLLYKYWLPNYETVLIGDYIAKDYLYIFEDKVIKCTKSGYIHGKLLHTLKKNNDFTVLVLNSDYTYTYDNQTGVGTIHMNRLPEAKSPILARNSNGLIYYFLGTGQDVDFNWYTPTDTLNGIYINDIECTTYEYTKDEENKYTINFNTPIIANSEIKIIFSDNEEQKLTCINTISSLLLKAPAETVSYVSILLSDIIDSLLYKAEYNIIYDYKFDGKYRKFTLNYVHTTPYYDTNLHEHLGKFIRVYSDLFYTDLRPYYNCFSYHELSGVYISKTFNEETKKYDFLILDEITDSKIYIVPVRFNHTYTIALDSPTSVTIAPIFLTHGRKLKLKYNDEELDVSQAFIDETNNTYFYTLMSISSPRKILFECKEDIATKYYKYRNNLYMLVLLPNIANTSITILEGDYTNTEIDKIIDIPNIESLNLRQLNTILTNKLSLLYLNTKKSLPFSNRLLEYLFDNVIDYTWEYSMNIERALKLLTNTRLDQTLQSGIWTNLLRYRLYETVKDSDKVSHADVNGNIDKDTEKLLLTSMLNMEGKF